MGEPEDFHAGGSDCSGIVWADRQGRHERQGRRRGRRPQRLVGADDPWVRRGQGSDARPRARASGATRPTTAATASSRARRRTSACRSRQQLTWEEAGLLPARARSTAYRMLMGWAPNVDRAGRCRARVGRAPAASAAWRSRSRSAQGGRAVAVVSDDAQERVLHGARRRRRDQPQAVHSLGHDAGHEGRARPTATWAEGRARVRQGDLGRARRANAARGSSSSIRARPRCRPRASSARPAAWS